MKNKILMIGLSVFLIGAATGCTSLNKTTGQREFDPVKTDNVKALLQPIVQTGVLFSLRDIKDANTKSNIVTYTTAVAGIFCDMKNTKQFTPEILLARLDLLYTPKIKDDLLILLKNELHQSYRLFWNQRLAAELPEDKWLFQTCGFFCDTLTGSLTDARTAGYIL